MFASQLLRILQTIPGDVNYETGVIDALEVKLTMKENQNGILCHSNGFEREADPLVFGVQDGDDSWNPFLCDYSELVDRRTDSDDTETRDSRMLGDQDGSLCHSNSCKRGLELSDDKDELCSCPEFERPIIVDSLGGRGEKGYGDSETLFTTGSQLFGLDSGTHFYTDINVRECELSGVMVSYNESNYHIVKDICVDEGLPAQDKTLIEADKDGHAGLSVSQPCGDGKHSGTTEGCHDTEPSPGGPKASMVDDIINSACNEHGTVQEVMDIATFSLDRPKPSSEDYSANDATNVSGPGNLIEIGEANWSTTERTVAGVLEDESAVNRRRSSQDSIAQDSLLHSSNCDVNEEPAQLMNEAPEQHDEVPSVEAILESLAVAFTAEDSKKKITASNLRYNSSVESGTITFDFKSPEPAVSMDDSAENSHEEILKSEDVPNQKLGNLNDHSDTTLVGSAIRADKKENIDELKNPSQDVADHSSQVQRGDGESSFSSSGPLPGLITYSGPIAYSGNISLRSDSSTTSTRSFAFPILQSEWNSSPVRMTKADRRHFRKHKDHEGLNKPSFPAFARKLKLHDDEANVKTVGNKHYIPYNMQEEALPDKLHHKEAKMVHARKGTRQEWMEGADTSQFFTMDYVPVRRRRPINNKVWQTNLFTLSEIATVIMASSALLSSVRNSIKKTHLPFKFHLFAIRPSSSLFSTLCKNQHSFTLPQLAPPVPKKVPFTVSAHGRTWQDPYHWMSNTNDPDFINYLNQENSYADAFMKDTVELQRTLYSEMVNRLPSKISTPPERWGPWLYYQYIPEGQEYPVLCRKLANDGEGWMKKVVNYIGKGLGKEEILLDWNEIAELYGYVHVGTCRISPDNNFLAYTLDVNGNEQFVLQIKDLQRKSLISNHRVEGVVNLAWARDSCSLFYTLCDQNQRPYRVQCVKLGSDSMDNVPLFVESDSRFCVDITSTKDGQFITVYVMDAVNPQSGLQRFCKRVSGVKYFLEHHEGFFYVLTNAPLSKDESSGCENYYLGRCRAEDLQSTNLQTIILPNEDMCLLDMDIFNEHIVLFLNQEGSSSICSIDMRNLSKCKTQVKIDDLNPWFFPLPSNMCTVTPGVNHDFMSPVYRVMLSSSVMPDVIVDYDMSTKTYLVVQQEEVPNIGQSSTEIQNIQSEKRKNAQENEAWGIKNFSDLYCCEKIEVISHDGIRVPLTVLCSKEEHRNGQSPGLLHGYGAYGEVLDKSWCADQLSLLDRGWLIAFADV
ncbi:hypothetical protein ACH5RR_035991, partial [Cinchona calisaya]